MMIGRIGEIFAEGFKKTIPDAFVFAILLTFLFGGLAYFLTPSGPLKIIESWYQGFWILLEFSVQVILTVATGYCLALSSPVAKSIDWIADRIKTPVGVYGSVMVFGMIGTLISFSFIILAAVLGRELATRVKDVHYPYLIACIYATFNIWVCGLSSSIPLVLNTNDNFLIRTGVLDGTISTVYTLGSNLNIAFIFFSIVVMPLVMIVLRPSLEKTVELADMQDLSVARVHKVLTVSEEAEATKLPEKCISDSLNHAHIPQTLLATVGLGYVGWYFYSKGFDINLNIIIFSLMMLGLLTHRSPMRYAIAMKRSCSNVSGILYQFPMYSGIMGIVTYTGLAGVSSVWMASSASVESLPAVAYSIGAVINFAIPSAGGEWAIIGGPLLETAKSLGSAMNATELKDFMSRIAMSVAYGESTSNYLQPFYLLLILPVMGVGIKIQARDVMGYLVFPLFISMGFGLALVSWMPM